MNDFEKIEDLLLTKRYEELSSAELKEVNAYFESGNEYNDMRDTLMQVKSTLAADKLLIKPPVDMKENLLNKFQQTYVQTQPGKPRPFYKKAAFQWSAAASIVVLLSISIFGVLQNMGGNKQKNMAANYTEKEKQYSPASVSTDTTIGYTGGDVTTGSNQTEKSVGEENKVRFETQDAEEENRPIMSSNTYTLEQTVTDGVRDDDKKELKQESQDESDQFNTNDVKLYEQQMNTTIPLNEYNTTKDNSTINQKARVTYTKKKDKNLEENKTQINHQELLNSTIQGNTTLNGTFFTDSLHLDSNKEQIDRRAVNTEKADSLEKK